MPEAHQRILGELALAALTVELGKPKALYVGSGRGFLWRGQRGDRPTLTVYLFLEPEGGRYPVRLMIGDPCAAEGQRFTNITVQDPKDINEIVVDIHRRMNGA